MATISVCMIVKNEERQLAECLSNFALFADELVVVDTGSTDRTKEIARQFTDKVYDYAWTGDFCQARNEAFSHGTMDYLLAMDADERIDADNVKKLQELKEQLFGERTICLCCVRPEFGTTALQPRMIKNGEGIWWQGIIHETIPLVPPVLDTKIQFIHQNHAPNYERNIAIMRSTPDLIFQSDFWLCAQCYLDCTLANAEEQKIRFWRLLKDSCKYIDVKSGREGQNWEEDLQQVREGSVVQGLPQAYKSSVMQDWKQVRWSALESKLGTIGLILQVLQNKKYYEEVYALSDLVIQEFRRETVALGIMPGDLHYKNKAISKEIKGIYVSICTLAAEAAMEEERFDLAWNYNELALAFYSKQMKAIFYRYFLLEQKRTAVALPIQQDIAVSVIILYLNAAAFVQRSLDSLMTQTLQSMEIICVDDGSVDGTVELLRQYQREHPEKKIGIITHERNQGTLQSRRDGLKLARGIYISYIDCDDCLEKKDVLEQVYTKAAKGSYDIYQFDTVAVAEEEEERQFFEQYLKPYPGKLTGYEIFRNCFYTHELSLCVWNRMYRRTLLEQVFSVLPDGLYLVIAEDFAVNYLAAYYADTFYGDVDLKGYRYYVGGGNTTKKESNDDSFLYYANQKTAVDTVTEWIRRQQMQNTICETVVKRWSVYFLHHGLDYILRTEKAEKQREWLQYLTKVWGKEIILDSLSKDYSEEEYEHIKHLYDREK